MEKMAKGKVVSPDCEVIVRVAEVEVAAIAYFKDTYGGFDVLVGLADTNERASVSSALRSAAAAVDEALPIADLSNEASSDSSAAGERGKSPF